MFSFEKYKMNSEGKIVLFVDKSNKYLENSATTSSEVEAKAKINHWKNK